MKIEFATWLYDRSLGRSLTKLGERNRLVSYYFLQDQNIEDWHLEKYVRTGRFDPTKKNNKPTKKMTGDSKVDLFLDSGAFSAKSLGKEINIQDYIDFIKRNEEHLGVYANLDVIGNPTATWENQKRMEDAGLNPLPVFHFGEDEKEYLPELIKRYDYIGFGGMVKSGELRVYLDRIFKRYVCDAQGMPRVKIHGFGMTSFSHILRYPWYSVDSTSWVLTSRMGSVFVPKRSGTEWVYLDRPHKIAVSSRSPTQKGDGRHFSTLHDSEKSEVLAYLNEKGFVIGESEFRKESPSYKLKPGEKWSEKKYQGMKTREVETIITPGLSNKYQHRDELNIIYFQDLEQALPEWPWAFKTGKDGFL